MTNLDSILKRRDSTLPTKVHLVKAIVFPVVMYGCESWTNKKAECWRIDAFELWYWRRLLKVPWTARRSNHSFLKEISPEYSLEALDAEAETPILWPPDVKNWLIRKNPDAGEAWRQEEKGMTEDEMVGWRHRLDGREFEEASGVGDGQGSLVCCSPWDLRVSDTTEWLKWTELIINVCYLKLEFWWFFSHVSRGFPGSFTSHDMDCIIELRTLYSETLDLTELCGKCSVFVSAGLDRLSPSF